MGFIKWIKDKTGTEIDETGEEFEEFEEDDDSEEPRKSNSSNENEYERNDYNENPMKIGDEKIMTDRNYYPVIRRPREFDDCNIIAKDIKENKMVTINIEELDSSTAQDLMDFLMGAISVTGSSIAKINSTVYTILPPGVVVENDDKSDSADKIFLDIK